jgi:HD-GYP domain-containing protein (c-di-GMP phosphodiesterase class II)
MAVAARKAEMVGMLTAATALALGCAPAALFDGTTLSVRFAEHLGWSRADLGTVYWYGLLRYAGCHAENHLFSSLVGDEIAFNRQYGLIDTGDPAQMLQLVVGLVQRAHASLGQAGIDALLAASLPGLQQSAEQVIAGHCDVAQRLAVRLGFDATIVEAIAHFRERWDGLGLPRHVAGEALPKAVRLVFLCHDVSVLTHVLGRDAALTAVAERRGRAYEPSLADEFLAAKDRLMGVLMPPDSWAAVLEAEPGGQEFLTAEAVDDACLVMADFCDLQLPAAVDHSRAVATLAEEGGRRLGLDTVSLTRLRRAALLHDLGYAALPVRSRGGHRDRLNTSGDVRLHPFHSEDVVRLVPDLGDVASLAGRHHEAMDGSGFYRGLSATGLNAEARLLMAAEAYQTALEGRFGAAGLSPTAAADQLNDEVRAGRLDGSAVKAVLAAAGHRVPIKKTPMVAGLTHRELDVLRLAASGLSVAEIGERLRISPKTADNHLQSIYSKIEVKTRAGATLFAIEHGICALPN